MPFYDFIIGRPGVLGGRVSKPQLSTLGRRSNTMREQDSGFPIKPRSKNEAVGQNVQVKIEPSDKYEDYEPIQKGIDSPFEEDHRQQIPLASGDNDNGKDSVLPSIERSPSPLFPEIAPHQWKSAPFYGLINGLRGGAQPGGRKKAKKSGKNTRPSKGRTAAAGPFTQSHFSNLEWDTPDDIEEEYQKLKNANKGSYGWTESEAKLHRILSLKGHHPLMPGHWKRDFRGINLEEILFAPLDCKLQTVLRNTSEGQNAHYRATRALIGIFALSSRVGDYLKFHDRGGEKAARLIEDEIRRYLAWAETDAGLSNLEYAPNIGVLRIHKPDGDLNDLVDELDSLMHDWTKDYLGWYDKKVIKEVPQTLFGLFVMRHLVLVLTADVSKPELPARCMAQLDLSRSDNYWLDHAMNLAIPINMARDIKKTEVTNNPTFPNLASIPTNDPDV